MVDTYLNVGIPSSVRSDQANKPGVQPNKSKASESFLDSQKRFEVAKGILDSLVIDSKTTADPAFNASGTFLRRGEARGKAALLGISVPAGDAKNLSRALASDTLERLATVRDQLKRANNLDFLNFISNKSMRNRGVSDILLGLADQTNRMKLPGAHSSSRKPHGALLLDQEVGIKSSLGQEVLDIHHSHQEVISESDLESIAIATPFSRVISEQAVRLMRSEVLSFCVLNATMLPGWPFHVSLPPYRGKKKQSHKSAQDILEELEELGVNVSLLRKLSPQTSDPGSSRILSCVSTLLVLMDSIGEQVCNEFCNLLDDWIEDNLLGDTVRKASV